MSKAAILAAGLAILAGPVFAGAQGDPDKSCDGGTYEMVQCLNEQTAGWDKRLNAAYQEALKSADNPRQGEQLRAAQRLWIQYRDANCLYYGLGDGTIARINAGSCMLKMTQDRVNELTSGGAGAENPGKEDRN
jgi:uncharacterized protein YecT (DUF1311 family)